MKTVKFRNLIKIFTKGSPSLMYYIFFLLYPALAHQPDGQIKIRNIDCFPLVGSSPRVKFNIQSHQMVGCDASPSHVDIVKNVDATVNVKGTGWFLGRPVSCEYLVNADWAPGVSVTPNSVVRCTSKADLVCICERESSL